MAPHSFPWLWPLFVHHAPLSVWKSFHNLAKVLRQHWAERTHSLTARIILENLPTGKLMNGERWHLSERWRSDG